MEKQTPITSAPSANSNHVCTQAQNEQKERCRRKAERKAARAETKAAKAEAEAAKQEAKAAEQKAAAAKLKAKAAQQKAKAAVARSRAEQDGQPAACATGVVVGGLPQPINEQTQAAAPSQQDKQVWCACCH